MNNEINAALISENESDPELRFKGLLEELAKDSGRLDKNEAMIMLRGAGFTYEKIAKLLHTSKRSLYSWAAGFKEEIANARTSEIDRIRQRFALSKAKRLEALGETLEVIHAELTSRRDFTSISTPKLVFLLLKVMDQILKEDADLNFTYKSGHEAFGTTTWVEKP